MGGCPRGYAIILRTRRSTSEDRSARAMRHDALQPAAMISARPIDLELVVRVGGAWTWLLKFLKEDTKII